MYFISIGGVGGTSGGAGIMATLVQNTTIVIMSGLSSFCRIHSLFRLDNSTFYVYHNRYLDF